ncbi:hypothetical protein MNBD_GAMMA12-613 [hydrothermal vent metagenome]|uniref:HNH nuclease domain-containing protein n=1 Tax=hydrothermal vent metagenome TaxID=652676 RepID=A0A3B0YT13_9ZZZZ
MGMPSYLKTKYSEFHSNLKNMSTYELLREGFYAGVNWDRLPFFKNATDHHEYHVINCLLKFSFKKDHVKITKSNRCDAFKKISVNYFSHHEYEYGDYEPVYKIITVSAFFKEKVKLISSEKESIDLQEITLRNSIIAIRQKVYASRNFPVKLKKIIFEGDNYTCQICGKHKNVLVTEGLHLECDHIKEWVDGGQTTYDNGQTVCSSCNKGKYHAKKYINNVLSLRT